MTYREGRIWLAVTMMTILLSGFATIVQAGVSWNISERSDEKIVSLNKALGKKLTQYSHLKKEPMFLLLADQTYKVEMRSYRHIFNRIYFIKDASAIKDGSRQFFVSGNAKIKETGAWRQRNGKIDRLDDSTWEIIENEGMKEIYFAPMSLEDDDIVGFSMETENDRAWRGNYLWLATDIPTMMNRTRIKTMKDLAYHISGYHLPRDGWSEKILEKSHEVTVDMRLTVVDIPSLPVGPWTPSEKDYLPYLYVSRRGSWNDDIGAWFYNVSWNEVAHQEMQWAEELTKQAQRFASWAKQRTFSEKTDAGKVDILHRFVRDEVVSISAREVDFADRDLVTAFNDRQATGFEKGRMLYALCLAAGIDTDLLVGRSSFAGVIDMGDPTGMQLVDFVVRLNSGFPRYYTPQYEDAAAGRLPAQMGGAKMMLIPASLPSSPQDIWRELASKSGGSLAVMWNNYRKRIKKLDWAQWETLPVTTQDMIGSSLETVQADPENNQFSFSLSVANGSSLQLKLRSDISEKENLEDLLGDRFPGVDVEDAIVKHGITIDDTLTATATLSGLMLPPPGANEWVLPAATVYGEPVLNQWDAQSGDPFMVRGSERRVAVRRAPLPKGWQAIKLEKGFWVSNARINYQSVVQQDNGELVIVRTLELNQGITKGDHLKEFKEALGKIQAHERSPVLIQKHK